MSMDRDPNLYDKDAIISDREEDIYDSEARSSNTLAYLIGGLVLAFGLFAFLFYGGDHSGDVSTTGSTSTQTERPATAPSGAMPSSPMAPAPTVPAAPARPATPQ